MIIKCKSCARKFFVKDNDIPSQGRLVKCGFCSVTWHQKPDQISKDDIKAMPLNNEVSLDGIKASDGKTYKFLGSQWAQLLPSGKTGLFAKKKIGKELNKLTGRAERKITKKKSKKNLNPSSEKLTYDEKLPVPYRSESGIGFFGYIFLAAIVFFSLIGVFKTFEEDILNSYPEAEYFFEFFGEQLVYLAETIKNIIVIIKDLINSY